MHCYKYGDQVNLGMTFTKTKSFFKLTATSLLIIFLLGCTTSLKESLDKIESGMDKSEVIDRVGSPNRSYRKNEQDVWLYRVHDDDTSNLHEITFVDGRVTYTGAERDPTEKPNNVGMKTKEQADEELRRKLKPKKKIKEFKEIKEDGSF